MCSIDHSYLFFFNNHRFLFGIYEIYCAYIIFPQVETSVAHVSVHPVSAIATWRAFTIVILFNG